MKSKKGVSLVILAIVIIVMAILAGTTMFVANDIISESKKATLISDLEQIEDLVNEYYLSNGSLPIVLENAGYSKDAFVSLVTAGKSALENEVAQNGDSSSAFYKLDLNKLDIENITNGTEKDGDITDAYFVASNTFNVYYLKGEKISKEYYFSLSEKLTGKTKISNSNDIDNSNITISNVTSAIKLIKSTTEFTNDLTLDIDVTLKTGETLKYIIAGQEITVADGITKIDVANVILNNTSLKSAFYQSENNKYFLVQKYANGQIVAESKINISNLDLLSENITNIGMTYSKYDNFILGKVSGYTDLGGSGLKEIRVLYTTKKQFDGTTAKYYDNLPDVITKEYVKLAGKSFATTTLKLPSDIASFALVFIDNAGNISEVKNFVYYMEQYTGLDIGDIVLGYTLDSSKTSYKTSGEENTAPSGKEVDITIQDTTQKVTRTAFTTWRYIGIGENGELLIAPDIVEGITDEQKINLSGKGGWINGPAELNDICNALYSTVNGTARSMNIDDINRILDYTGPRGRYKDVEGNYVETTEAIKIGDLEESLKVSLSKRKTPENGKNLEDYYSNYYAISKGSAYTLQSASSALKTVLKNFVFTSDTYWLASSCAVAFFNSSYVDFYVRICSAYNVSVDWLFNSSGYSGCRGGHIIRPVVALDPLVKLKENESGEWQIIK